MSIVAFDFDGTLSDSEMTVLLGEQRSVADEMAAITERAMNDEIDYATSLRERAALLEGLSVADAQQAFDAVYLREGSADLITALRDAGVHVAILTGGFERGVERALERENVTVDTIVANRLPVENGELTGTVEGPLIEGTKDDALDDLVRELDITGDTIAVGDGANDLPMLEFAASAIGYEPKPAVEPACDVTVSSMAELQELLTARDILSV
ncbi:phosphoserine phosphatase SerB [Halocatena marina]|uniref:phosphoserine phosphatase SerB n=1 Tax=Halocatena marina TaxID=2934937 RepID=UPI0022243255|nr:phosphoserine phosphatase SerB [Halocatena marina]